MSIQQIKDYLDMVARMHKTSPNRNDLKYSSVEDFVLQHGREWISAPLPEDIERQPLKQCFRNAIMLAVERNYRYVEGYAFFHIPIYHAWCLDENDKVVDPTWDNPETHAYFGVAFNTDWAMKQMLQRGKCGILDDMDRKFPILRGKIKPKF